MILVPYPASTLACRMSRPLFEQWKGGKFKIVSFFVGKARGLMARYATLDCMAEPAGLRGSGAGTCARGAPGADVCVFRRKQKP